MSARTLLVCPGRGSYGRASLGYLRSGLAEPSELIRRCDAFRRENGRIPVSELDADTQLRGQRHVAGENASLLTFACSLADRERLDSDRFDVVGVVGNSMGFYTALVVAGALSLDDGIRLVDTMGAYQTNHVVGGQILYPDSDGVEAAIADVRAEGHRAWWSIRLGGTAVLGGDAEAVRMLLRILPKVERGARVFPVQLPLHSAFHELRTNF